jgi:vacuolar-type H+-ATPase subunit H
MERVWEELKKIEAQAESIRAEAQNSANKITDLARQQAEKIIANAKTYAEEHALQLYTDAIQEANRNRDEQLKASVQSADALRARAEKRLDKASSAVEKAVLGETKR